VQPKKSGPVRLASSPRRINVTSSCRIPSGLARRAPPGGLDHAAAASAARNTAPWRASIQLARTYHGQKLVQSQLSATTAFAGGGTRDGCGACARSLAHRLPCAAAHTNPSGPGRGFPAAALPEATLCVRARSAAGCFGPVCTRVAQLAQKF